MVGPPRLFSRRLRVFHPDTGCVGDEALLALDIVVRTPPQVVLRTLMQAIGAVASMARVPAAVALVVVAG